SIAHGGYLLVALLSANDVGKGAVLFYLLAYAVTNLGAFGVIAVLESAEGANDNVRDYAGLCDAHPALAALMTLFLLSLGRSPPPSLSPASGSFRRACSPGPRPRSPRFSSQPPRRC